MSKVEKREIDELKRRKWDDFSMIIPATKIIPDKKKQYSKYCCRGKF